jgi:hypothetical protein
MSWLPVEVYQGQPAATETTMTTVASGKQLVVKEFVICNTDTVARTLTVHVRRGGVAAGIANRIMSVLSMDAGKTVYFPCSIVVAATGVLSGVASVAATITVTVSGEERTI